MPVQLPITVDKQSGIPVYIQLGERIRLLIRQGRLHPGDPLPTVRELAVELGINANTVARVYRELQADGVLRVERGVGTSVAQTGEGTPEAEDFHRLEGKALELIELARQAGMRCGELSQLIEARWQEIEHER
jgi:GntR family transcriptional regulator